MSIKFTVIAPAPTVSLCETKRAGLKPRAGEAEFFGVLHKALADAIRQSVMEDGGERSPSSLFELRRDLAEALAKAGKPEVTNK